VLDVKVETLSTGNPSTKSSMQVKFLTTMLSVRLLATWICARAESDSSYLLQLKAEVRTKSIKPESSMLPAVETLLSGTTKSYNNILKQTSLLEAELLRKDRDYHVQLFKLKANYEQKLHQQEKDIAEIMASIKNMSGAINKTEMSNAVLRQHATTLRQSNLLLRVELEKLEAKLQTARAFAAQTLNGTDDTASEELAVLNTPKPVDRPEPLPDALSALSSEATVEQAMDYLVYGRHGDKRENLEGKQEGDLTLLQVRSTIREKRHAEFTGNMSAESLLEMVSAGVKRMEAEYINSTEHLSARYQARAQSLSRKKSAAISLRTRAEAKLQSSIASNKKLHTADVALEKTHAHIQQRISGLKLYLAQLAGKVES